MSNRYRNLYPHSPHGLWQILQWKCHFRHEATPTIDDKWKCPQDVIPQAPNHKLLNHPSATAIQITWIGHASFLVQAKGLNFLFDPVFEQHCSPIPLPGTKRHQPPALVRSELPSIHGIFISHNHYDHLEQATVRYLGKETFYHIPNGNGPWLLKHGGPHYREYSWWDSHGFGDFSVHCVPAQHFSSRGLHDRNLSLWCGWILEIDGLLLYYVGDTGYAPIFHTINEHFGPMDIAIIPIGCYSPRWVMRGVHVDPDEAVRIHEDVGAQLSLASHWGSFTLTDESLDTPPARLRQALVKKGLSRDKFRILRVGETISVTLRPNDD